MKKIINLLIILFLSFSLFSCNKETSIKTDSGFQILEDSYSYFTETHLNKNRHIYVCKTYNDGNNYVFSTYERIAAQAVQGLYARKEASFAIDYGSQADTLWLKDLEENYGLTFETIDFETLVNKYIEKFGNKYILYDASYPGSGNSAMSLAGAFAMIPIEKSLETKAIELGLVKGMDVSNLSEMDCFYRYKDHFSTDGAITTSFGGLIDIGVASNYFFFWPTDLYETDVINYRIDFHSWLGENKPLFGSWPDDEVRDVALYSSYGQFVYCSGDGLLNTTLYACKEIYDELAFKQQREESETEIVPEMGKHYVCFVMSDGDNLNVEQQYQIGSERIGATRTHSFPIGWSMSPALVDLSPNILSYYYNNYDSSNYYVASVSGVGYMNPRNNPSLQEFVNALSVYLRKSDMHTVQILDSGPDHNTMKAYAEIPELLGAFYCYGHNYAGGAGSVYWENDKPFISIRESISNMSSASAAYRINSYDRDYTKVTGYTAINLHYWSSSYQQACEIVDLLDDDVVVITALDMVKMITKYCEHEDYVIDYIG